MKPFLDQNFLLENETAIYLYHTHASKMPIYDYHCHIPPAQIATNHKFTNLTDIWLRGDHYKWRAMRSAGIDEKFITGDADDFSKFQKWADTVPQTLRNPLYHWTHLELQRYFGISEILDGKSAAAIWEKANEKISSDEMTTHAILKSQNVKLVCTTDDPIDNLEHHKTVATSLSHAKMVPGFRPDAAMKVEFPEVFKTYIGKLEKVTGVKINSFDKVIEAIDMRHLYFHENGCRISDHGVYSVPTPPALEKRKKYAQAAFKKALSGVVPSQEEIAAYHFIFLEEVCLLNGKRDWTQQFHVGVLRNNNTKMFKKLGPDTGFDTIGDTPQAAGMIALLDALEQRDLLARTILYNINPADNELFATMLGIFQDGKTAGKIQLGSGWWFLDQKNGMIRQLDALSSLGLLPKFVGMLTDSRSFLSYPRHEYFRRILCNLIGNDVEKGELPNDKNLLGKTIEDICYNNSLQYFKIKI